MKFLGREAGAGVEIDIYKYLKSLDFILQTSNPQTFGLRNSALKKIRYSKEL